MSTAEVIWIMQRTLGVILGVAGPILAAALVVGVLISVVQAATQVNEATLTFVPKLIVVAVILLVFGQGMLQTMVDFSRELIEYSATVAR
jgi:flagellar biosynthesis protein FliQ